jgi:(p)ppGpp synthase/HD superfamily hydrolase
MAVSGLVLEHGGDEDMAIAGLLHDAAEDQCGETTLAMIRRRYGDGVASIVADCTDAWTEPKPPWRERKEAYIASVEHKPSASRLVSLADKTYNARAILSSATTAGSATPSGPASPAAATARSGTTAPSEPRSKGCSRGRWRMSCGG